MNNNRNNNNNSNNNRRRGRGNNRPQGGGGRGEQLNRIDSRARGNAPQMLEKYRKLAQDAHLNGDRVTAEYYLQFADHYFRVIADMRQRQDEQRQRRDDRPMDDDNDEMDFGDNDFPSFDQPPPQQMRREERRPPREQAIEPAAERAVEPEGEDDISENQSEPSFEQGGGNPFTRDNRSARGLLPRAERGERAPRRRPAPEPKVADEEQGFDPSVLPPAIAGIPGNEGEEIAPAPAPRRRGRRPKATGEDAGGSLETVNG